MISKPFVGNHGIFESEEDSLIVSNLTTSVEEIYSSEFDKFTDQELIEVIRKTLSREIMRTYRKKPIIDIHVIDIGI